MRGPIARVLADAAKFKWEVPVTFLGYEENPIMTLAVLFAPVTWIAAAVLLIVGVYFLIQMFQSERGSARRKERRTKMLCCLIPAAVLYGCYLFLLLTFADGVMANM